MPTAHSRGETIHSTICILFYQEDTTGYNHKTILSMKKLVCCCETVFICLCYFYLWFLCELTGKHGSAASLEMLNLDMRKTNNICLLSKTRAELPPWWRYHTCRRSKAVRCLYHTVIPNMKRFSRIPVELTLLKLSGHLWQGESLVRVDPRWAFTKYIFTCRAPFSSQCISPLH